MSASLNIESNLVVSLRSGEVAALEYIYDHYSSALYGVALKILRGRGDLAEEVLQDAYAKIWYGRESYDEQKASLFTWMLTILRNAAIDKLRGADFRETSMNHSDAESVHISERQSSEPLFSEYLDLRGALTTLPEEQFQIIDFMYFRGYTQSEISEQFKIPLGTVKSRARLAMASLRTLYGVESKSPRQDDKGLEIRTAFAIAVAMALEQEMLR